MPVGVIINVLSVVIGGMLGAFAGEKLPDKFKNELNLVSAPAPWASESVLSY